MKWPVVTMHGYSIKLLGEPCLEQECKHVKKPDDLGQRMLIAMNVIVTTSHFGLPPGLGISANQVGGNRRVCIARVGLEPGAEHRPLTTMVNPRILRASEEREWMDEGCLSIPGFRRGMLRHTSVTIGWQNEELIEQPPLILTGQDAQVLQHELDHLNGLTILEGASRQQRRQAQRFVEAIEPSHSPEARQ